MIGWLSSRLARGSGTVSLYAVRLQNSLSGLDLRSTAVRLDALASEPFGLRATLVSVVLFACFAYIFARSGNYFVGLMLNDFFLLSEIAYRYAHGDVPGYQFTNPIGIFAFAPQALVYWITGDLVLGAIVGQVFYGALILAFATYVSFTRLNVAVGLAITLALSILMLSPWVLGSAHSSPVAAQSTTAMAYNKFGFIAVALAALLATLPRRDRHRYAALFDAPVAALLAVLAFYSKVPFGLAVVCLFTFWNLVVNSSPGFLIRFASAIAVLVAASEIAVPGLNLGYLSEQAFAGSVAGVVNLYSILRAGVYTLPELIPGAVLPLALLAFHRIADWRSLVYFGCLIVGSLGLLTVSAQGMALVTPMAVAAYALVKLMGHTDRDKLRGAVLAAVLGLATTLATYVPKAITVILQHNRDAAASARIAGLPQTYSRLRVPQINDLERLKLYMNDAGNSKDAYRSARSQQPLNTLHGTFPDEYLATLVDLGKAQPLCGKAANLTTITDFTNASASILGHRPVGGYAYMHFGRSFSRERHPEAAKLFKGADCLFDPKLPIEAEARDAIWDIYREYLMAEFAFAGSTTFWRVHVRK